MYLLSLSLSLSLSVSCSFSETTGAAEKRAIVKTINSSPVFT
jgi:hypothetical protein